MDTTLIIAEIREAHDPSPEQCPGDFGWNLSVDGVLKWMCYGCSTNGVSWAFVLDGVLP